MKQKTNRTMLLLPCAVIVAMIGITAYFACSADVTEYTEILKYYK